MKIFMTEHDTFNYTLYDEFEAMDTFGYSIKEDPECFSNVPEQLVKDYKEVYKKFWDLNFELSKYEKKR